MRQPGFVGSLSSELETVPEEYKVLVDRVGGLLNKELLSLTARMDADPAMYHPDYAGTGDVSDWKDVTREDVVVGEKSIANGEVAFVLLGGGAPIRLFERIPNIGISLLGWRLLQAGNMPVWVMVDPRVSLDVKRHISMLALPSGMNGCIFEQFLGYRLTPDNRLLLVDGEPQLYTLGHGDVGPALVENGVIDDNPGVKYAYICNVDNVLASPHPGIVGRHMRRCSKVTCEVVEKAVGDRGGVVAWVNNHLQVAEDFRLPTGFSDEAKYYNTNTMIVDIDVLKWRVPWRWHKVRKLVDSRVVIQYERLLQQYTEECRADYLLVPRESRYCCVKDEDDMDHVGTVLESYRYR